MSSKKTTKKSAKKSAKKVSSKVAKKAPKKGVKKGAKKAAKTAKPKSSPQPAITHESLQLAAYYLYLERMSKGIPGNADGDWAAASKQLSA